MTTIGYLRVAIDLSIGRLEIKVALAPLSPIILVKYSITTPSLNIFKCKAYVLGKKMQVKWLKVSA